MRTYPETGFPIGCEVNTQGSLGKGEGGGGSVGVTELPLTFVLFISSPSADQKLNFLECWDSAIYTDR